METSGYAEPACYRLLEGGERCWRPEGHEGECAGRAMDDREIITTAIEDSYDVDKRGEITNLHQVADTVLAAIEACGRVIVPVEATVEMLDKGYDAYARKADDIWSPTPTDEPLAGGGAMGYAYRAMIAASKGQTNG